MDKQLEVRMRGGESVRGTLRGLSAGECSLRDSSGLDISIQLSEIDSIVLDPGLGNTNISRPDGIRFLRQREHLANKAGLTLAQQYPQEFRACMERSGSVYFKKYLEAELAMSAAAYDPASAEGYLEVFLREELTAYKAVHATLLFRARRFDEAVAVLLQELRAGNTLSASLKLACLYSQMNVSPSALFWLDTAYRSGPEGGMFSGNIWWQYLRLCNKYGAYESLGEIMRGAAEHSPAAVAEGLAYLLMANGSRIFGMQMLELAQRQPSTREALEALELYFGFLQSDPESNYHRYRRCLAAIIGDNECRTYKDEEFITGYVYEYIPNKGFGFLLGFDLVSYFFRAESIESDNVRTQITANICSFIPVENEAPVLVNFRRSRESKQSYNAIQLV